MTDERIQRYREAALAMKEGQFEVEIPVVGEDEVAGLGKALSELRESMEKKFDEMRALSRATERINSGLVIDDVLNHVYDSFRPLIPYNRIGFSLIDEDGKSITAHWARSDSPEMQITKGYSRPLEGSSLMDVINSGKPRILNDLEAYLEAHPDSDSTRRIVAEGIRSSLSCPLIAMGKPIGVMFFSSMRPNTYRNIHTEIFVQIAGELAVIVEKARMYQQLLELNELKNKFLGMAAHDLRNPIGGIRSIVEMMLDGELGPQTDESKEMLTEMEQACTSMLTMINDLLDVSAIESGHLNLRTETVDLPKVLEGSIHAMRLSANRKNITIELHAVSTLPRVTIDPERLRQAVDNLVSNAIKYSPAATKVTISAGLVEDGILVSVADHGQGIAPEEISKLFKEFSRTSARPTAGETSTGLGLAIVKKIIEAHGGKVWAESELKKGSIFYFTVPFSAPGVGRE